MVAAQLVNLLRLTVFYLNLFQALLQENCRAVIQRRIDPHSNFLTTQTFVLSKNVFITDENVVPELFHRDRAYKNYIKPFALLMEPFAIFSKPFFFIRVLVKLST